MAKGKKRKGSAKPKEGKSKKEKGQKVSPLNLCNNCNENESTETIGSCDHKFCKDCFENLAMEGVFHCSLCDDGYVSESPDMSLPTAVANRLLDPLPSVQPVAEFTKLGKGIKKITSFTHSFLDTTERVVVDQTETFICVNPADHKLYYFKDGKFIKSVKYLYNHGFTGGLSMNYNGDMLIALQGSKLTSICYYTTDGKFRTSSFFQKRAYAHHIAVGTNNAVFALDAQNSAIHFFNKEKKMCQSWSLRCLSLQDIDLWDCLLLVTKDNRLYLFHSVKCNVYEIVNDDEVVLKISFTAETITGPEMSEGESEGSIGSLPTAVYDSMWTKKRLTTYESSDEENDDQNDIKENEDKSVEKTPVQPISITNTTPALMLHDIKEDSKEESDIAISIASSEPGNTSKGKREKSGKSKGGKKGKKGKGSKKSDANKNNNANGNVEEDNNTQDTTETQEIEQPSDAEPVVPEPSVDKEATPVQDNLEPKQPIPFKPITFTKQIVRKAPPPRRIFDPREHPSILVLDKYDCMILAHRGQIALFSPKGQFIKTILDLLDLDENHYKLTIKQIVPFGENKLAVLWHKLGCRALYRFLEIYTYNAPKKYRRVKSMYGRRKFTYDQDVDFENWAEGKPQSSCCVIQ